MTHDSKPISQEQYLQDFELKDTPGLASGELLAASLNQGPQPIARKAEKALEHALDIRKFEIDLYWRRATYFWTFIGAAFAGYSAVQTAEKMSNRSEVTLLISCLGLVFSLAWFLANAGSKQWQENWETHVDMLEDAFIGPLYKTVLKRPRENTVRSWLTAPKPFSVSKINQILSLFVTVLWIALLLKAAFPLLSGALSRCWSLLIIALSVSACVVLCWLGRTHEGSHLHHATKRQTEIASPSRNDC